MMEIIHKIAIIRHSFNKLNLSVLYDKQIRTTDDDSHPPWGSEKQQQWHNGIYVAILKKN